MITVIVNVLPDEDGQHKFNGAVLAKSGGVIQHFTEPLKVITFLAAMDWSNVEKITIKPSRIPPHNLTPREVEFLRLAASDDTYEQIADKMNISLRTVDGFRETSFQKTGARSRVGLVLWGIKNGIINI